MTRIAKIAAAIFFTLASSVATAFAGDGVLVDRAFYLENEKIVYPVVTAKDAAASGLMNRAIRAEVERFVTKAQKDADEMNLSIATNVSYEIPCNLAELLSVVLTEYRYVQGAAHPAVFRRALNFNSATGARITAAELGDIATEEHGGASYSPENVSRKLREKAQREGFNLFDDFKGLAAVPEDFYFDAALHVHFIFQQYEVAPYAYGTIDLDADSESL